MIKYLIPMYYTFHSRFKTINDKISWMIIYFIPVLLLTVINFDLTSYSSKSFFFIVIMTVYSVYELGYIENDVVTIKKEKKPTIRIKFSEIEFIEKNYRKIICLKLVVIKLLLISLALVNWCLDLNLNIYSFVLLLVLMKTAFYFHNSIRNNFNILTFFLLSVLKYITPVILFVGIQKNIYLFAFILFMFNIPRTLEHSTKIKYNYVLLQKIIGNHDTFRVKYYFATLVFILIIRIFVNFNFLYLFIIVWFFTYRAFVLTFLNFKIFERKR